MNTTSLSFLLIRLRDDDGREWELGLLPSVRNDVRGGSWTDDSRFVESVAAPLGWRRWSVRRRRTLQKGVLGRTKRELCDEGCGASEMASLGSRRGRGTWSPLSFLEKTSRLYFAGKLFLPIILSMLLFLSIVFDVDVVVDPVDAAVDVAIFDVVVFDVVVDHASAAEVAVKTGMRT